MEKTLATMTSAQEPIGGEAKRLIQEITIYRQQVEGLQQTLFILRDDSEKFTKARSNVLNSIKGIDNNIMHGIVGIRHLIDKSNGQELIVSLVISGSVLAISLLGLLVAWKMSSQLENTTRVAVEAESQQLLVNEQLTQEINQREKAEAALRQAHDDLELRVNERTAELSNANAQLQAEIIERLAAEKNLADERERLAVTLSSIGDGVISTDTAGIVTLLNQNAEKLTGWDQHDAIGRPLYEIFHILHEEARGPCASPVDKVLATGGMIELANHTVLIAKDGREINIADSGAPIHDKANRIIGVVLVFRDVTEQLKQEKELFSAQKMESIGTLAGGIAHDFNNILSAIIGYTELAMMRINPKEPAYEDLRQVRQASNRATDLVRQILTFSRQQQQAKAPLQLSLVVKEALKLLRASIPSTIEFHQEIMSEATVMADPTQMHQVIMNLCTNAYHAMMEHGGVLRISLEEVLIAPTMLGSKSEDLPPGCYLRLAVSDSGCGMEKELMGKIFEPYFTTKEQGKGTGLGLAVVHGIVKSHDGRISVDSEPGRGTAFNVYLPMIVHDTLAEVIEEIPPMAGTHERVMVVDDEGAIRDLTSQILIQAGYRVETFVNGLEAWQVLSQAPQDWDLLITDQTMPEMTGDQLAAKALELRPDLPILICSGYNAILLPDGQTKGPGVITYLQKPVGLNALLTQVAKSLEAFHAARPLCSAGTMTALPTKYI
jgi:PAS domain S-box-containing protein